MSDHAWLADERACWLALHRISGIGPRRFKRLLTAFGTAAAVLAASPVELAAAGLGEELQTALQRPDWSGAEQDLCWLATPHRSLLLLTDPAYPAYLREIANPPPVLFVEGDPQVLQQPQIAVVGSRRPTRQGQKHAFELARQLAELGIVVTSGLALGIDASAHRGALAAHGRTIAVAATGLDQVYPARHRDLALEISQAGAVISEFPSGVVAAARNFPRRNRIISGLCLGTLVVEAATRSGSLLTAQHAAEQGREVFAVPGSIDNPLTQGCHQLIRQGAKLVEGVEDILEECAVITAKKTPTGSLALAQEADDKPVEPLSPEYRRLLACLSDEPQPIDALIEMTGLTAPAVSSMLLLLEMQDGVVALPGGLYIRHKT